MSEENNTNEIIDNTTPPEMPTNFDPSMMGMNNGGFMNNGIADLFSALAGKKIKRPRKKIPGMRAILKSKKIKSLRRRYKKNYNKDGCIIINEKDKSLGLSNLVLIDCCNKHIPVIVKTNRDKKDVEAQLIKLSKTEYVTLDTGCQ